jgi:RHS repeat-associated protein
MKLANATTYTGRSLDTETGLYYYRNRYYHAQLGRFVGRDPIGYEDGVNLYQFVRSMPTQATDPLGNAIQFTSPGEAWTFVEQLEEMGATNVQVYYGKGGVYVYSNSPDLPAISTYAQSSWRGLYVPTGSRRPPNWDDMADQNNNFILGIGVIPGTLSYIYTVHGMPTSFPADDVRALVAIDKGRVDPGLSIDIGGEGRNPGLNINPSPVASTPKAGDKYKQDDPIPGLFIYKPGATLPFPSKCASRIVSEDTPVHSNPWPSEIIRIAKPGGTIIINNPYPGAHGAVIKAVGTKGRVTTKGPPTTVIRVNK